MKKSLLILSVMLVTLPLAAQKLSKEEKAAAAKAAYSVAVESVKSRNFVIVPSSYTQKDGLIETNIDNANFLSCEGNDLFAQGLIVCDNKYTNILDAAEYTPVFDKKGNMKLRIVVIGRMMRGTYSISMRNNTNIADVIFTPQSGETRKFSGPLVPLRSANYNKRANPI